MRGVKGLTKDRYRSSAHFADFQDRSSLNCSKKTMVRSWKRALKRKIAPKTTAVCSYVCFNRYIYMYLVRVNQSCVCNRNSRQAGGVLYRPTQHSTILTALFCPYITHERIDQNLILTVRSLRFALFVKERHCFQNEGLLKSD